MSRRRLSLWRRLRLGLGLVLRLWLRQWLLLGRWRGQIRRSLAKGKAHD